MKLVLYSFLFLWIGDGFAAEEESMPFNYDELSGGYGVGVEFFPKKLKAIQLKSRLGIESVGWVEDQVYGSSDTRFTSVIFSETAYFSPGESRKLKLFLRFRAGISKADRDFDFQATDGERKENFYLNHQGYGFLYGG
ncbi:MAG: hypothetical protein ACPGJV_09970 [Bacteriovoracaceae bacterium]